MGSTSSSRGAQLLEWILRAKTNMWYIIQPLSLFKPPFWIPDPHPLKNLKILFQDLSTLIA